jgi:hypothetical protein
MTLKKYKDRSFLSDIQNLELISGYNFKKINNKSTKSFIFICSYINKKNEMNLEKKNLFNFEIFNFQNESFFEEIFIKNDADQPLQKVENCKFKIIFKKISDYYVLFNESNFFHCHSPKKLLNKHNEVSYRNIKFTYNFVFNYFNSLCDITNKNKINLNLIIKELKTKKKSLKKHLVISNNNKITINKKISQFIKAITKIYIKGFNYNKKRFYNNNNKKELLKLYIKLFLKQNANSYLRFEDIEKLNDFIN